MTRQFKTLSLDELFEQENAAQRAYRETPEGKAEDARLAAKLAERIAKGGAEDLLAPMDEEDEEDEDEEDEEDEEDSASTGH